MSVFQKAKNAYIGVMGFHTPRHLLVIESDDWGSIRMPSRETFERLQRMGDHPEKDAFLSHDCLETEEDLQELFAILRSVKDAKGNPAVITANFAMANPVFEQIDYSKGKYVFEAFHETYSRSESRHNNLELIKAACREGVFRPQLHCREHLNVRRWMRDLAAGKKDTITAFYENMYGIGDSFSAENQFGYMDAFNYDTQAEGEALIPILKEAAEMFKDVFGFTSDTFVASCFVWGDVLEKALGACNIRGIQCGQWQLVPSLKEGTSGIKRRLHYTGEKGRFGQVITVRNCAYEPAYSDAPAACAEACFAQVRAAFKYRKPAIINSHRFNYIDSIQPGSAKKNRAELKSLLERIMEEFPDTCFISSDQLLQMIKGNCT